MVLQVCAFGASVSWGGIGHPDEDRGVQQVAAEREQRVRTGLPEKVSDATRRLNPHVYGSPVPAKAETHPNTRPDEENRKAGKINRFTEATVRMTKTERDAEAFLRGCGAYASVWFNPCVLRLRNGHRYTPDFLCDPIMQGSRRILVEVKGAYRLGSYQRARMAFDQARIEFPEFGFLWIERTKDGWSIK